MKKLIALVAALVMVAGTAYAAEWNFYGSSRVYTTYTDTEVPGANDIENFGQGLQGNSRIGANVKVNDELSGRFEYGTGVNVRLLYGEWNFGAGSLLVGQSYTPLNMFYSNQIYDGDIDLLAWGGVYSGRAPMLQLKFGGFKIAAVAPASQSIIVGLPDGTQGIDKDNDGDYDLTDAALTTYTGYQIAQNSETDDYDTLETGFPTIEASYSFSIENFSAQIAGAYNSYEASNGSVTVDVDAYTVAVGGKFGFGPAYLGGNMYIGQNADLLILTDYSSGTEPARSLTGTTVNDIDNFGFILVAGAKINDMFAVEAGYGYAEADPDSGTDDEVTSYYLQATITLAPGVFIVPELGQVNYEEAAQNEITYGAVKWQINF